jgi:hypothetical protein
MIMSLKLFHHTWQNLCQIYRVKVALHDKETLRVKYLFLFRAPNSIGIFLIVFANLKNSLQIP